MKPSDDPQRARLKRWLIAAAIVYLLMPRDLVPDFLGRGLGLVDDLALIAGMAWFYRRRLRDLAAREAGQATESGDRAERRGRPQDGPATEPRDETPPDPHTVLGVPRSASQEEIRAAYRARMRDYQPDRVAHLGEELQRLAHRKTLEIQGAFERLRQP